MHRSLLVGLLAFLACCQGSTAETVSGPVAVAPLTTTLAEAAHGRVEQYQGLRILRLWGTPEQRGHAHGLLLGKDIAAAAGAEFGKRFGRKQPMLDVARKSLERNIDWPEPLRREIEAMWRGVLAPGAPLRVEELDRDLDLQDLLLANALDVYGLMGCSGLTVWGEQVEGGGVLTARNFDWPYTGPHMVDQAIVLVQHVEGRAFASVTWPGYVGVITGVSSEGVAAFLHVGNANITYTPEPESWPTAVAARAILEQVAGSADQEGFAQAQKLLGNTSAPAGYITRVVFPQAGAGGPVGLFEADRNKVVRATVDRCEVTTNHFQGRSDGREASKDSIDRQKSISAGIEQSGKDGGRVTPAAAWQMLAAVQRGGSRAFGTLHSLVFRHAPWCFELRIAEPSDKGLVAAPESTRRWSVPREVLFPKPAPR
jgi:hypothetical protein